MLSILIPSFNTNIFPLVVLINNQCAQNNIIYEIKCLDDCSTNCFDENKKINQLQNCCFEALETNVGRSKIRNMLADKATYNTFLFLDADTMPVHNNFIKNYLDVINKNTKVVYGGVEYLEKKTFDKSETDKNLRLVYGKHREALCLGKRKTNPYLSFMSINFLVTKSVFEKVRFNENIPNLRYEDVLFSSDLREAGIEIEHINNPVFHLGIDTSEVFLHKSETSLVALKYMIDNKIINPEYAKISRFYTKIKYFKAHYLVRFIYSLSKKTLSKQLLGNNPSLLLFDFYRLGYLCSLK